MEFTKKKIDIRGEMNANEMKLTDELVPIKVDEKGASRKEILKILGFGYLKTSSSRHMIGFHRSRWD